MVYYNNIKQRYKGVVYILRQSGIYIIKDDIIEIRLPNPNDIIFNWGNVSSKFKKDFISVWHDTFVLSKEKVKSSIYGVPNLVYRELIILDHIGYLVNTNKVEGEFKECYKMISEKYSDALNLITLSNNEK